MTSLLWQGVAVANSNRLITDMLPADTAVIVASPVKKRKGHCLDPASKHHSVKLLLGDSSGGVVLKSVVLSSLRLSGESCTAHYN